MGETDVGELVFAGVVRRRFRGEGEGVERILEEGGGWRIRGLRLAGETVVAAAEGDVPYLKCSSLLPNVDGGLGVACGVKISSCEDGSDSDECDRFRLCGVDIFLLITTTGINLECCWENLIVCLLQFGKRHKRS